MCVCAMEEAQEKESLLGLTCAELTALATREGLPSYTGQQLARWLYAKGEGSFAAMTDLSKSARSLLAARYTTGYRSPVSALRSADGTVKYLFPTSGGQCVETVFIPDGTRGTVCVSCQVGCKMACAFCQTGRQHFGGSLTAGDILTQVYALPERSLLTNIVFMGQGEPLDNLDNVLRAVALLQADYGLAWSPKRITVSTVGTRRGLPRLLDECSCHVAVSLHAARPAVRRSLMPAEGAFSITEIVSLLRQYDFSHQRRLTFEYVMLRDVNDSLADAAAIVSLLRGMECRVNLIRFHESEGLPFLCSTPSTIATFSAYLSRHGVRTTTRLSRGEDISAACGQLTTANKKITND